MNIRPRVIALLVAAALSGGAHAADADEAAALTGQIQAMDASTTTKGQGAVTGKIASDFQSFAGSTENSTALVNGLRNGSEITLTQKGERSATFTPATKPMGFGNVSTSLALARFQLAQQGITNPTPTQLQTALNGGTITVNGKTVDYQGILQMRADGMGWGQIAQSAGTKLGPVVSGIKTQNAHIAALPAPLPASTTTAAGATAGSTATANGNSGSTNGKGVVTASGAALSGASPGKSANHVTTAGGDGAAPRGQGIVTAGGSSASPAAHGAAAGRGGVVTAAGASAGGSAGGGPSNGKALGHAK